MIAILIVAIVAGWIVLGAFAWLAQTFLRVVAIVAVEAWRSFEGDERRYRRLRPWYRG